MLVGRYRIRASPNEPPVFAAPVAGLLEVVSDPFRGAPLADGRSFASADLEPLLPCVPSKVIAVARNYRSHANEFQNPIPEEPLLFLKPPSALLCSEQAIRLPPGVGRVDFEGELVLVIGQRVRHVDRSEARAAILGVTCGNDVSARELQKRDGQWTRAKGFDTFGPVGPAIALGVDFTSGLTLVTRVNGDERQRCNTNEMIFGVLDLVVFASTVMTLEPGDLIFTGTPAGVGPLSAGDVVEVEIEGVGVLRNPVSEL